VKRRETQPAKEAERLEPKGTWSGPGSPPFPGADVVPPADKHSLTHSVTGTERGTPTRLPQGKANRKGS